MNGCFCWFWQRWKGILQEPVQKSVVAEVILPVIIRILDIKQYKSEPWGKIKTTERKIKCFGDFVSCTAYRLADLPILWAKGERSLNQKRIVGIYGVFLLLILVVVGRLYLLASNLDYAENARSQTITTLELPLKRGTIYDINRIPLTDFNAQWYALALPGDDSYVDLFRYVPYESQTELYQRASTAAAPFLIPVERDLSEKGVFSVKSHERLMPLPIAVHILGYLDQQGHGVSGVEQAFDDILFQNQTDTVHCTTTARGSLMNETQPILQTSPDAPKGVQLTLDKKVQRVAEGVAYGQIEKGAILVLDTKTAEIRGAVSCPMYDPNNIQKSIQAEDTSLINRNFSAFNIGSVFKPLIAAAALEKGWSPNTLYECKGWVDVDGQVYRCAMGKAHGQIDMAQAQAQSCNCYFVELGKWLGAENALKIAQQAGFGQGVYFSAALKSAAGTLPTLEDLQSSGELANFSFGQGKLTGTPIQVAAMINIFANKGIYKQPTLVKGQIDEGTGVLQPSLYFEQEKRVVSEKTAQTIKEMLCGVVNNGLGSKALPTFGGAGGKTGTAQTGRFNKDKEELTDVWFAGFWPSKQPRYTIVVLLDETLQQSTKAAELFSQVCNGLEYLEDTE